MSDKVRTIFLFAVLVVLVMGFVYWFKSRPAAPAVPPAPAPVVTTHEPTKSGLPLLVEVGSSAGPADLMMAAVLTTLREGFGGRLEVEFVNAGTNQSLKAKYGVTLLPTQIYYAPDGKELHRHPGFASEEEILKKWKDLGYDLMAEPKRPSPPGE